MTDAPTLTLEELDRLEKLVGEATPGPWYLDEQTGSWRTDNVPEIPLCYVAEIDISTHDEQLLLALRNAAPALLPLARRALNAGEFFDKRYGEESAKWQRELDDATRQVVESQSRIAALEKELREERAHQVDIRDTMYETLGCDGHRMWADDIIPRAHQVMRERGELERKLAAIEKGLAEERAVRRIKAEGHVLELVRLEKELEGEREARRSERQRVIDTIRTHATDVTLFAKGRALDLMAWILSLPDASELVCSRCGQPASRSYEAGRCHADDCEPATMDEHDEAITREEAFGSGLTPPAPPEPEVSRDERAGDTRKCPTCRGEGTVAEDVEGSMFGVRVRCPDRCNFGTLAESADRAPVEFADHVTRRKP